MFGEGSLVISLRHLLGVLTSVLGDGWGDSF